MSHCGSRACGSKSCGSKSCGSGALWLKALWLKGFVAQGPVAQRPVAQRPVAQGLCGSRALWLRGFVAQGPAAQRLCLSLTRLNVNSLIFFFLRNSSETRFSIFFCGGGRWGLVLIAPHVIQELYCPVLSIIVRTEQFYNTSCVSTADQNLLLDCLIVFCLVFSKILLYSVHL